MSEKAVLIIVILPPSESNLPLHPANLFCILSTSDLYCSLLGLHIVSGNAR